MKTACPTCGAPVEFRYDDSFVRICDHCRAAVLRTDRGVETLGKVADLVPMDSPLRLFADGHFGSKSFLLVGMAQIRHSAGGLWQEWYAKFDGGTWGWIAEAQGRYYLTLEQPEQPLPPQLSFEPGSTTELPVHGKPRTFTVSEMGSARYVAAMGELPYRLVPEGTFRFVDLSDGAGTFATIDYGEQEGDKPTLYVGSQVPLADLGIHGGEITPTRAPAIKSTRIACPNCNGSLEIRAQGQTQRIVCAYCNTLLDASSPTLAVIAQLDQKPAPEIPLGSKGTFSEGEMIVIGYVQRSAEVEGVWYPFEEYLLYEPTIGFRWLVEADGQWSYVQPVETGAVESDVNGVRYDGVKFRRYQVAQLRVDQVVGEFYWQVSAGETVESEDCVAPPAMMSREASATEENWSLSTYMTVDQVQHALGDKNLPFGAPQGVAPNQPNPWLSVSNVMAVAFVLLCVSGIAFAMTAPEESKTVLELKAPAVSTPTTPPESPAEIPNLPIACRNWTAAATAIATCDQLSRDTRDALKQAYDDAAASWVSFPAERMAELAAPCQAGATAVNQAAASASCAMPPPMAPLPDVPVVALPAAAAQPSNVFFSQPFQIDGGRNIQLTFIASGLDNNWAYISADLVNDATGAVVTLDGNIEHYSGYEDGESWSEGSRVTKEVIGPQPEGTYLLRVETLYGGAGELPVTVSVKQGVFRFKYFAWSMALLMIPFLIVGLLSWSKERARWENSITGKAPATPVSILILILGSGFTAIVFLLKAIAASQSNDD